MPRHNIITINALGSDLSLVPERYDPIRFGIQTSGVPLSEVAQIISASVSPSKLKEGSYVILDTTHAFSGVVNMANYSQAGASVLSNKKTACVGDVIISRLRPYLRQAAYLDAGILKNGFSSILCSTEFFVLRSIHSNESIAYLVPFLLSEKVQAVLAASQEGGHHPRFNAETLLGLCIPESLYKRRHDISRSISDAVKSFRESESTILDNTAIFNNCH